MSIDESRHSRGSRSLSRKYVSATAEYDNYKKDESKKDESKDVIQPRIKFIRALLHNNNLDPIIDFDNTDTEAFISKSRDDNDSGESYDTRVALKKKYLI